MSQGKRSGHQDYRIIDALNEEWRQLVEKSRSLAGPASADPVREWVTGCPALDGCNDLADVLARVGADPDAVLGTLIRHNQSGNELAGRVVLQAMLGKLVTMARRDAAATVDEYVAHLWCRIRTYPLARRPARIAANLALDTLKHVTADHPERTTGAFASSPVGDSGWLEHVQLRAHRRDSLDHNADVAGLDAHRVISAATRLGLIDAGAARVLRTVYADGLSGREAAAALDLSPAMVRFRCSRSVRRLAGAAAELAMAA